MKCYKKNTEPMPKKHCCCLGIGQYIDKYGKEQLGIAQYGFDINGIFGTLSNKDMQRGKIIGKRHVSYQ